MLRKTPSAIGERQMLEVQTKRMPMVMAQPYFLQSRSATKTLVQMRRPWRLDDGENKRLTSTV